MRAAPEDGIEGGQQDEAQASVPGGSADGSGRGGTGGGARGGADKSDRVVGVREGIGRWVTRECGWV
jgi:hypothetical protein